MKDFGSYVEIETSKAGFALLLSPTDFYRLRELGARTYCPKFDNRKTSGVVTHLGHKTVNVARFITTCPDHLQVDHINRNPLDNRPKNLRLVTSRQNNLNRKNNTKHPGVWWNPLNKNWRAAIYYKRKQHYLGSFSSLEDAISARQAAEQKLGYFSTLVENADGHNHQENNK